MQKSVTHKLLNGVPKHDVYVFNKQKLQVKRRNKTEKYFGDKSI